MNALERSHMGLEAMSRFVGASEVLTRPEYENARLYPVNVPKGVATDGTEFWVMSDADPMLATHLIMMEGKDLVGTGGGAAKYSHGLLIGTDGTQVKLFSKRPAGDAFSESANKAERGLLAKLTSFCANTPVSPLPPFFC